MEKRRNEIIANRLMIDFLIVILAGSVLLFLMRGFSSSAAASITRKIVVGMSVLSLVGCGVSEYYINKLKLQIRWDMMFGLVFVGCVFLVFPGVNTTKMLKFLLCALPVGFVVIILYYTVILKHIRGFRAKK